MYFWNFRSSGGLQGSGTSAPVSRVDHRCFPCHGRQWCPLLWQCCWHQQETTLGSLLTGQVCISLTSNSFLFVMFLKSINLISNFKWHNVVKYECPMNTIWCCCMFLVWTFAWILIPLLKSWDTVWPQDTGNHRYFLLVLFSFSEY